jgi:hypothetical protein
MRVRSESLEDVVDAYSVKGNWMSLLYFHRNEAVDCCSRELHMRGVKCSCAFSQLPLFSNKMAFVVYVCL